MVVARMADAPVEVVYDLRCGHSAVGTVVFARDHVNPRVFCSSCETEQVVRITRPAPGVSADAFSQACGYDAFHVADLATQRAKRKEARAKKVAELRGDFNRALTTFVRSPTQEGFVNAAQALRPLAYDEGGSELRSTLYLAAVDARFSRKDIASLASDSATAVGKIVRHAMERRDPTLLHRRLATRALADLRGIPPEIRRDLETQGLALTPRPLAPLGLPAWQQPVLAAALVGQVVWRAARAHL